MTLTGIFEGVVVAWLFMVVGQGGCLNAFIMDNAYITG